MSGKRRTRVAARIAVIALACTTLAALVETAALAAPVCVRDGDVLRISLSDARPQAYLQRVGGDIRWGPYGDPDRNPCIGNPTVHNIDRVRVSDRTEFGSGFGLFLSGGPFEPGRTDEGDGSSEIEFVYDAGPGHDVFVVEGGPGRDHLVCGRRGVNLGPDGDTDVVLLGARVGLAGGAGRDVLSGAGGHGTGRAHHRGVTLFGDDGDDRLIGTPHRDRVGGGEGWDVLRGGVGADTLDADRGNDLIAGGRGRDSIQAGIGNDRSMGQAGPDSMNNDHGNDTMSGGGGRDLLGGGEREDRLYGNRGADRLFGAEGDDFLSGHAGDDHLKGGDGSDECRGGEGDDTTPECES